MVHKIKGWARDFEDHGTGYELGNGGGWAEFSEDGKEEFGDVPCTLVTTHEALYTKSEVDELIKAGNAMSVAMYQYQMDVDDDPPQKHRDMMNAWEAAVLRFSDPA